MDTRTVSKTLSEIYHRLITRYGPQHWWPAQEPFEVIVGAILTQSAAWSNVEKAIANLRVAGALSPRVLRTLPHSEIAGLIRPSGYYNAKAHKLKAFAQWFGERYNDNLNELLANDIEPLRQQLLSIYGIGDETADSIILYVGHKPIFVVDAYTRRIINRIGLAPEKESYAAYQSLFMAHLPAEATLFNEYHALLVCLGKDVCHPRPLCPQCCLNGICPSHDRSCNLHTQSGKLSVRNKR